jgi:ABC-2 type transport system ATP-binding protein
MSAMLETTGLAKEFRHPWNWRRVTALQDVSFEVEAGEVFGLIGPNGAGKTTTFKLLLGLLRPTRGEITFDGHPLDRAARARIGFLPEQSYFYDHLTVQEMLAFYAQLHGLSAADRRRRVAEVIEQVQLGPKRDASLRTLSKGTLQRVGVAQAIINQPRLVILDEPMSGLDPAGRHHLRQLILSLRDAGTTVIFSSHILPDAEALCTRVGILTQGMLREVVDLQRAKGHDEYEMAVAGVNGDAFRKLAEMSARPPAQNGVDWLLRLPNQAAVCRAVDVVRTADGFIKRLTPVHPSLEERFLAYTGHVANLD